jgi:hypothetical protein
MLAVFLFGWHFVWARGIPLAKFLLWRAVNYLNLKQLEASLDAGESLILLLSWARSFGI